MINDLRKTALSKSLRPDLKRLIRKKIRKENIRLDGDKLFVKNKKFFLNKLGRIFVIGVGKCFPLEAAAVLEDVLKERVFGGIVIDVHEGKELKKIKISRRSSFPKRMQSLTPLKKLFLCWPTRKKTI